LTEGDDGLVNLLVKWEEGFARLGKGQGEDGGNVVSQKNLPAVGSQR